MDARPDQRSFDRLLDDTRRIAREVAARHAGDVDARGRFPVETVAALREIGALAAPVPRELGGAGLSITQLAALCSTLAQGCGSSGMVLAMHYIQVACIVRHGLESAYFRRFAGDLVARQPLLASITSEVGTGGDMRSSVCAVEADGERFTLAKEATTGSYCADADAILVTCRRAPDAPRNDQVLVLVHKGDATLSQTTSWDSLGMRGTCSPGFSLRSRGAIEQVVPGGFADIAAQTMVPVSHVLWSSLWWGIAADAVGRAASYVRGEARRQPGTVPPTAEKLARVQVQLQAMRNNWIAIARDLDDLEARPGGRDDLLGMPWALRMNNLKSSCSDAAPQIVHGALQIVGILGYKNDTPFSVGRQYRDVLSASLMISNDRIAAKNAALLLVVKDDA